MLAVVASIVLANTARSADPEENPMSAPLSSSKRPVSDPNPVERISVLVAAADLIVKGTIESVDEPVTDADTKLFPAQHAILRVSEVLKGEAEATITVSKPEDTWYYLSQQAETSYDAKFEGIFALKTGGESYVLFANVGVHDYAGAWQEFDRVLAGLPEEAPAASEAELAEWAAHADIIVFARARGTESHVAVHTPRVDLAVAGTLTPIEVLKGEIPEPLDVVRGTQPDVPGGTWWFPVTDKGQTGVYFIDTSSGRPTVINTTNPSYINRRRVPLG